VVSCRNSKIPRKIGIGIEIGIGIGALCDSGFDPDTDRDPDFEYGRGMFFELRRDLKRYLWLWGFELRNP
jgi:hypothetical protein